MRAISKRIGKLEFTAARACARREDKLRIRFVSPGKKPGTVGRTRTLFIGDEWTDEERAAALEEDAASARRCPR